MNHKINFNAIAGYIKKVANYIQQLILEQEYTSDLTYFSIYKYLNINMFVYIYFIYFRGSKQAGLKYHSVTYFKFILWCLTYNFENWEILGCICKKTTKITVVKNKR